MVHDATANCEYAVVPATSLDTDEVAAVYESSGLAQRRPIEDRGRLRAMLDGANLVVVARVGDELVGICRSVSDFAYATYLADLAVSFPWQRLGVGRELIEQTRRAAPLAKIILLSAPNAVEYYPHVGFTQHQSAWTLPALG